FATGAPVRFAPKADIHIGGGKLMGKQEKGPARPRGEAPSLSRIEWDIPSPTRCQLIRTPRGE
ncbi:MAG: hypothetical protein EBT89_11165, partial [Opitutaceae bacterium]|nr:hypothetical protein [Opitutaceae bacterium]